MGRAGGTLVKSKSRTSGKTIISRKWGTFTQLCFRDVMEKWADQAFKEVGLPVCVGFGGTNVQNIELFFQLVLTMKLSPRELNKIFELGI